MILRNAPALLLGLLPIALCAQQTEVEPNENTSQATNWTYGQTMSGSECNPPSFDADYFRIVLPFDGVITFTATSQGTGPSPGDLQFALFPKSGFYQQYHTLPGSLAPTTQTFSHSCLSGDTMYVRVQESNVGNNSCIDYSMSFVVAPAVFANDLLPNDDPQAPQMITLGQTFQGHLSHLYDGSVDWYGVTLPVDGTLRIIAEAEHADTATAGVMSIYVDVNNTTYYLPIGANHVSTIDTFIVRCFAAQLVRFVLQNSGSGDVCGISYRMRIEQMPHVFANDTQPNDDPQNPQMVALDTPVEGHLAHFGDQSADWYGITLPDDGTLLVIAEAAQHDTISTGAIQFYLDQANSNASIPVGPNAIAGLDTFEFHCLRAGLIRMRLQPGNANGCGFSYRVRFQLVPPVFGNDPEPNQDPTSGSFVAPDTDQDGHMTYIGTDSWDYFKLWKGYAGTMRIVFASSLRGTSPGLNVYIVNTNSSQPIETGENGAIGYDTVDVYTANPDTIWMSIGSVDFTYCGSYRFQYSSTPVGIDEAVPSGPFVRPNPSRDGLFTLSPARGHVLRITITDAQGQVVVDEHPLGAPSAINVDLSGNGPGVYSARLLDSNGSWSNARLLLAH